MYKYKELLETCIKPQPLIISYLAEGVRLKEHNKVNIEKDMTEVCPYIPLTEI